TNNGVNVRNAANHNLRISNNAGRRVENLKEVDLAHVVVRNNDAYVAIKLNNRHRNNQANTGTTTNTGNNLGTTGGTGTSNAQG
ncbi:YhcN/YlaJ family sporulation lipoprotein, partial [Alkalihalophilus pseudofirmus]